MANDSVFNGFVLTVPDKDGRTIDRYLPTEIVSLILSYADFMDLFLRCRLVCRSWKSVVEKIALRLKADREFGFRPEKYAIMRNDKMPTFSWYIYYLACVKRLFGRNLLKNNCGQNKLKYWRSISPIDNDFRIEEADSLPEDCDDFDGWTSCFVTHFDSFKINYKKQVINLSKQGVRPEIMDKFQPVIRTSEWVAAKYSCGVIFEIEILLLNHERKIIYSLERNLTKSNFFHECDGSVWKKIELDLKDYGPGVRYISFRHGIKSEEMWNRYSLTKIAGGVVKLELHPRNYIGY